MKGAVRFRFAFVTNSPDFLRRREPSSHCEMICVKLSAFPNRSCDWRAMALSHACCNTSGIGSGENDREGVLMSGYLCRCACLMNFENFL